MKGAGKKKKEKASESLGKESHEIMLSIRQHGIEYGRVEE